MLVRLNDGSRFGGNEIQLKTAPLTEESWNTVHLRFPLNAYPSNAGLLC